MKGKVSRRSEGTAANGDQVHAAGSPDVAPPRPPSACRWFRTLSLLLSLLSAFLLAEVIARLYLRHINQPSVLDPGFVRFHSVLGWTLTPLWKGRQRHHDFDAVYTINELGFRADSDVRPPPPPRSPPTQSPAVASRKVCAIVGDSFTFGVGVNDHETFVHLLNQLSSNELRYVNWSIPGYSTDQEALLIEAQLQTQAPDLILLVVYLANDLLDLSRTVPLQVPLPKPWFEPTPQGLLLHPPTPGPAPPRSAPDPTAAWIMDTTSHLTAPLRFLTRRSALTRLTLDRMAPPPAPPAELGPLTRPSLELFTAILAKIAADCARKGVPLHLATLPGRSFLEAPEARSAVYQAHLNREILAIARKQSIPSLDLATELRVLGGRQDDPLYYQLEGHLTAQGHQNVAGILDRYFSAPPFGRPAAAD